MAIGETMRRLLILLTCGALVVLAALLFQEGSERPQPRSPEQTQPGTPKRVAPVSITPRQEVQELVGEEVELLASVKLIFLFDLEVEVALEREGVVLESKQGRGSLSWDKLEPGLYRWRLISGPSSVEFNPPHEAETTLLKNRFESFRRRSHSGEFELLPGAAKEFEVKASIRTGISGVFKAGGADVLWSINRFSRVPGPDGLTINKWLIEAHSHSATGELELRLRRGKYVLGAQWRNGNQISVLSHPFELVEDEWKNLGILEPAPTRPLELLIVPRRESDWKRIAVDASAKLLVGGDLRLPPGQWYSGSLSGLPVDTPITIRGLLGDKVSIRQECPL